MTFCLGPDGNNLVFNAKLSQASAQEAYQKLTTPVFGAGVVYDCDNALLMQQKKMAKDALTVQAFREYVPIIINETRGLMKEWGIQNGQLNLFHEMAELTIRTASSCLLGKEIRSQLQSNGNSLTAFHSH
jgi:sterol 14-demethylase